MSPFPLPFDGSGQAGRCQSAWVVCVVVRAPLVPCLVAAAAFRLCAIAPVCLPIAISVYLLRTKCDSRWSGGLAVPLVTLSVVISLCRGVPPAEIAQTVAAARALADALAMYAHCCWLSSC